MLFRSVDAVVDGENFMTLEVDATDQLQWGLPQFPEITKQDGTVRLKSHSFGHCRRAMRGSEGVFRV